jgi:hypothetical protein
MYDAMLADRSPMFVPAGIPSSVKPAEIVVVRDARRGASAGGFRIKRSIQKAKRPPAGPTGADF